jgi:ligand-binding SRPBCC domain-containing protein
MKEFTYHKSLWLPYPREQVFDFFADAHNLERITPPFVSFKVLTGGEIKMQPGTLIDYRILIRGIPVKWRTEIREWEPPHHFVDVQLKGPYKLWHHTHTFEEQNGGTTCLDDVRYWPLGGALTNWLFVHRDVEKIFAYRTEKLSEIFKGLVTDGSGKS